MTIDEIERRVTMEPNTGCWLWLGTMSEYAQAYVDGKTMSVPRLVLGLKKGDGLCACHRCDNPACVNPAHLFIGTIADNNRDMMRKGRFVHPETLRTHCAKGHPFSGENLRISGRGHRICQTCDRAAKRAYGSSPQRRARRRRTPNGSVR